MFGSQLTNDVKTVRVQNAAAAGTSSLNGTSVDMQGYDGVRGVYSLGALTATQVTSLKAQDSADNSTFADITGATTTAMADADSNKMLVLDVYRPVRRYVRFVLVRGTANAVVDGGVAEQYKVKKGPVSADSTVSQQAIVLGA